MALKEQNSPYKKPVTRKRKAENDGKGKPKGKKGKKGKKKGGRALETDNTAKPNGAKCKLKSREKVDTYDENKIPKGLPSIKDLSIEKKRQIERQLALDGLDYSFDQSSFQ